MTHSYASLNEAAQALLVESCSVLNQNHVEYVVAGGWVPFLRGSPHATLRHPGTKDVDVLFNDNREAIGHAVQVFLKNGFLLSAKHEFQLLKPLLVNTREFIFNVDLMHPAESFERPDMFQDILDLGISSDYDEASPKVKSICFPSSAIIFEQRLWSKLRVEALNLGGNVFEAEVPLISEAALILSKAESVSHSKRMRDAFDIYFLLSGSSSGNIVRKLKHLSAAFPQVSAQLSILKDFLDENPEKFDANVLAYQSSLPSEPSKYVRQLLFS